MHTNCVMASNRVIVTDGPHWKFEYIWFYLISVDKISGEQVQMTENALPRLIADFEYFPSFGCKSIFVWVALVPLPLPILNQHLFLIFRNRNKKINWNQIGTIILPWIRRRNGDDFRLFGLSLLFVVCCWSGN